jgi:hypothetical protein
MARQWWWFNTDGERPDCYGLTDVWLSGLASLTKWIPWRRGIKLRRHFYWQLFTGRYALCVWGVTVTVPKAVVILTSDLPNLSDLLESNLS